VSERPLVPAPDLDAELRALAGSIEWPATPDLAAAVLRRLGAEPKPSIRPGFAWPRLGRAFVLAVVLLLVAVAIAAAIVLGLPGLRIAFTRDPLPSPNVPAASVAASSGSASPAAQASASPDPPGVGLALGTPVSLETAAQRLGRPLLIPGAVGRPPDAAYVESVRGAPIVTLVWRAGRDLSPVAPASDVGLLISQFGATLDEALIQKLLHEGDTKLERLDVAGHPAYWISGVEHILWFRRPDGDVVETFVRLVGDTLAVEIDGRIVRIETSGGRDAAIVIAESLV
jgi:hypothetical protein